jgi:hypothetical protein
LQGAPLAAMLSRSFESRHPLSPRQILWQRRELSRRPDGLFLAVVQDEYATADEPYGRRVERREAMLLDRRGACAFARATYGEWLEAIERGEDEKRNDMGTAIDPQAA